VAVKRNRWLVGTILILALAAFLSLSLLPILGGNNSRRANTNADPNPSTDPAAMQAELEAQARGYELVLEREPENQTALEGLVDTRIQLGDIQGVVDPLQKLVELNPEVTDYAVLLAQTKQQIGDLEGAAQTYRDVLDQRPGDMNALQGLVALLVQQERPQAAIGLLQDTLNTADQLGTDSATTSIDTTSVKLLLAQVYVEDNQTEQAITLYDELTATAPDDFRPILAKALVLQEAGQAEEAKSLFAQATAMAPSQFKDQIEQMAAQANSIAEPVPADGAGGATESQIDGESMTAPPPASDAEETPVEGGE
jgi:tetratricopeptide (TPR) repeat protein